MLDRQDREALERLRDEILDRSLQKLSLVEQGALSREQADEQLSAEYGHDYLTTLEETHSILRKDALKKRFFSFATILLILAIPAALFFDVGGLTGFLTYIIDAPETIQVDTAFQEDTVFIPDIRENITSLRATGTYVGTGSFRLVHIDGSGKRRVLYAHETEPLPDDALLIGGGQVRNASQAPAKKVSFAGQCQETCSLNQTAGPHQLAIEVENGTVNLTSITFTERVVKNASEKQTGEGVYVAEETVTVPRPAPRDTPTPTPTNETNETAPNITRPENETAPETPAPNETQNQTRRNTTPPTPNGTPAKQSWNWTRNELTQEEIASGGTYQWSAHAHLPPVRPTTRTQPARTQNSERRAMLKNIPPGAAPSEEDLPPFTRDVGVKASRATHFAPLSAYSYNERWGDREIPPNASAHYITTEISKALQHDKTFPAIIIHDGRADQVPLNGTQYGNLFFTNISSAETKRLYELGHHPTNPLELITIDRRVEASIEDVDEHINGPITRAASGANGTLGVCVIDSGINHTQQRFADNYVGGIDYVDDDHDPMDAHGHGTLMADAIIAIAPGAQIYAARVLDEDAQGRESDVIQAIDWCMQQDVSIISMSLGGGEYESWCDENSLMAQKANEAAARGLFVSAAAGNLGSGAMTSPACGSEVTSAGASTGDGENESVASYSGLTSVTDILAPGSATITDHKGENKSARGTSVSAAVVSAGAAVIAETTGLTGQDLQERLRATGIEITEDNETYSRIDLQRAYNETNNTINLTQNGYQSENTGGDVVSAQACIFDPCISDAECGSNDFCDGSGTACHQSTSCDFAQSRCFGSTQTCTGSQCDGQQPQSQTCSSGSCVYQDDGSACSGNCDSYCSGGACQDTSAGNDPYGICSGSTSCSGQNVVDNSVCGSGTSCGYTTDTCSGSESDYCSSGSCSNLCSDSSDNDGNGWTDSCDGACGGAQQCSSGTCCDTSDCSYRSSTYTCRSGSTCDPEETCTGSSASCPSDQKTPAGSTDTGCSGTSCSGGDSWNVRCDGSGSCDSTYNVADYCNGNTCSGQQPRTETCSSGSCVWVDNGAQCAGNCDSWCSGGACQNTAAGQDPYGICSGSASCSGQDVVDTGVCGSGTSCGYTTDTCAGTCADYCSGGSCSAAPAGTSTGGCSGTSCSDSGSSLGGGTCTEDTAACDGSGSCDSTYSSTSYDDACGGDTDNPSVTYYSCSGSSCVSNNRAESDSCSTSGGSCSATDWDCSGTPGTLSSTGDSSSDSCSGSCGLNAAACETTDGSAADACTTNAQNPPSSGDVCSGGSWVSADCSTNCGYDSASCSGENYERDALGCTTAGACSVSAATCSAPADTGDGAACSCDGQCTSSLCDDSVYEGSVTSERCLADASYCVDGGGTVRSSGYDAGTSTCYGDTSGGSVWLADSGRWEVQNSSGSTLAVVDKYGSMGVRGAFTSSAGSFENGWQLDDSSGTTVMSVASVDGDLRIAGSVTERTSPSGTGMHIQDTSSTVQAVLSSTGNVLLSGDFAYSLSNLS